MIVIAISAQNANPTSFNQYPQKLLFLVMHGPVPTFFIIFYVSILISKSPNLKKKLKTLMNM